MVFTRSTSVSHRASSTSIPPSWLSRVFRWKPVAIFCSVVALGEHVAGDLLDGELAERQVPIEGVDDPVAVHPGGAAAVLLVAVGVGVSREVQPGTGPALAVVRRGQQAVDDLLVGVGARVGHEGVHLGQRRRQRRRGRGSRGGSASPDWPRARGSALHAPAGPGRSGRSGSGPRPRSPPPAARAAPASRRPSAPSLARLLVDGAGSAGIDPGLDPRDLRRRKRRAFEGHARLQDARDPLHERAAAAVAGNHDLSRTARRAGPRSWSRDGAGCAAASAPWQRVQRARKIGWTSRAKSTRSGAPRASAGHTRKAATSIVHMSGCRFPHSSPWEDWGRIRGR